MNKVQTSLKRFGVRVHSLWLSMPLSKIINKQFNGILNAKCFAFFLFYTFLYMENTFGWSRSYCCKMSSENQEFRTEIYCVIVIYAVMAKHIGTLGKYDKRRLWKLICIVNPFDFLFKNSQKSTFIW